MTGFQLFSAPQEALTGDLLNLSWFVQDENLFLQQQDGDFAKVLEIGGVSPHDVFALVDYYIYSENVVDRNRVLALHSRYSGFIELAGGVINDNATIITLEHNGEVKAITFNFDFLQQRTEDVDNNEHDFVIRHEFIDDIFFIDFRSFRHDDAIDETVRAIEQAIERGTRRFIVDLRGNSGGNSWHGQRLLQAMGITIPSFGAVRRFSDLYIERAHWLSTFEHLQVRVISPFVRGQIFAPSTSTASNPNDVFVSVLTDRFTYSSATMMAVWVQDGGLGNVIGGISSNAPSAFGDMLHFELPYLGISIRVSHARFLRPDASAYQQALIPDILVDPVYALDIAIEHLRNMD
jgi:C-terminal processing protease CtpA/Prc